MEFNKIMQEMLYWCDEYSRYTLEHLRAEQEFNAIDSIKDIKKALLMTSFDVKTEAEKKRLMLISDEWQNYNKEYTIKTCKELELRRKKENAKIRFETSRSQFSFLKTELSMLGDEFNNSKIRG